MTSSDSHADGRKLLREMIAERTGQRADTVVITAVCPDCGGSHGRPEAEGSGLHLSLSYSAGFVVAAVASSPVGIDVERREQGTERLDAIETMTGLRDVRAWTRTEAVLKADGRGLRVDPAEVTFEGDRATLQGTFYDVSEVAVAPDLVVSVAVAAAR